MKSFIPILIILPSFLLAQTNKIDSLKTKVNTLEKEKKKIDEVIQSINIEMKELELEVAKKKLGSLMEKGIDVITTVGHAKFYVGVNLFDLAERISLGKDKKVTIYPVAELYTTGYCYKAMYGDKIGWIYHRFFNEESFPELEPIVIEMSKEIEAKKKRGKKESNVRKKSIAERKRARIIKQYGEKIGALILQNKIEVGMTKGMVIASLGYPADKNITTNRFGVNEQWVYRGKRYEYVYIDDGIVSSFQTKY